MGGDGRENPDEALAPASEARRSATPQIAAAVATWDFVRTAPLWERVRAAIAPAVTSLVQTGTSAPPELFAQALDELVQIDPTDPAEPRAIGEATGRDALLALLRTWAATAGLEILPADWTFARGCPLAASDGLQTKVVFRRDVPVGWLARVKAFGLARGGEAVRPGEAVVSAGPPPRGLTELELAAEAIPGPEGEEVRQAFRDLRPAGAGGYLELAAIDLYSRFWDRAHPVWSRTDPGGAERFAHGLGLMLAESFGLTAFTPLNCLDHPHGWVIVPAGARMLTGRVVRVLRPGLAAGDALRVPARVEVE